MTKVKLPAYVNIRTLAKGNKGYYWVRPGWADPKHAKSEDEKKRRLAIRNGKTCPFETTPLGTELGEAITRANAINAGFKDWRLGRESGPGEGTVAWLFAWYRTQPKFTGLGAKTRTEYQRIMDSVAGVKMKTGTFGDKRAALIEPETADKLYVKLREPREPDTTGMTEAVAARVRARAAKGRERQAAYEISTCRAIWSLAARNVRKTGIKANPFEKMKIRTKAAKGNRPTSRDEYDAYRAKAREMGKQSMATAAALAFEGCQRVWDVFGFEDTDGRKDRGIKWADYAESVTIGLVQSKTGNVVELPLVEVVKGEGGKRERIDLYPELEEELKRTPRTDDGVIVRDERTGQPYTLDYMQKLHRRIRIAAGLPDGMTFTGFRHGGLTEAGDAGSEDLRAISGHSTLAMTAIYNRANERKARAIATRRREHIAMITEGDVADGIDE